MKKKILSFLLSFVLLISAFPLSAYAYSHIGSGKYTFTADDSSTVTVNTSVGGSVSGSPIIQRRLTYIDVDFPVTLTGNKGDIVTFEFKMNSDYYAVCQYLLNCSVEGLIGVQPGDYVISDEVNFSSDPVVVTEFQLYRDCENEVVNFNLFIGGIRYTSDADLSKRANIDFSLSCEVIDSNKSLLNSIIEYIKEIFNSLKELPTKIQSFFTDLKNNMSAWFDDVGEWFSELKDNISAWFSDVGEWFTQLGDNLKQWFDDVGNWFSELFTNISNFFTDLWDGFIEWFKSLFFPRDGYFTELLNFFNEWILAHFGFLAQAANIIISLIETISNLDGTTTGIIIFPEIRLPFLDNPLLMEQQEFDLLSYINSISVLKQIYEIYQVIVTALFIFFFVKYAYRKFEEILKGREVTD